MLPELNRISPKQSRIASDSPGQVLAAQAKTLIAFRGAQAVGWGVTLTAKASEVLQFVELPVTSFQTCFNNLSHNLKQFYTDDKFCAGFVDKSTSVCTGDSGGGLVFATDDR